MKCIYCSIAMLCTLLLASCGSGSGNNQPAAPPKTSVYSSAGDASKYLGKWSMDCGMTRVTPTVYHGTTKFMDITATNGTTITGKLTVHDYGASDLGCQGTSSSSTTSITIQVVSTAVVDNTNFTGSTDKITYTPFNSSSQTLYSSFNKSFDQIHFSTTTDLSIYESVYSKL